MRSVRAEDRKRPRAAGISACGHGGLNYHVPPARQPESFGLCYEAAWQSFQRIWTLRGIYRMGAFNPFNPLHNPLEAPPPLTPSALCALKKPV